MPVLVGVTVWFCVMIASPVAKSVLSGAFRRLIISLGFVTLKTVAGRIRQAEEEYRTVVELRDDHTKMSRLIVGALVPLCFCFVVVMLPIFLLSWDEYRVAPVAFRHSCWRCRCWTPMAP